MGWGGRGSGGVSLGEDRCEKNGLELGAEPGGRQDRHFRMEIQKSREPSGLKIQIEQSDALMQRLQREREVCRERSDADSTDHAGDGDDHAALAALAAPSRLADFKQRAGGLSGVEREEQDLVGA